MAKKSTACQRAIAELEKIPPAITFELDFADSERYESESAYDGFGAFMTTENKHLAEVTAQIKKACR